VKVAAYLESTRLFEPADIHFSPPEASWRAMTDPSPPVPMIAVVTTETYAAFWH
jgi:hypothetical protein